MRYATIDILRESFYGWDFRKLLRLGFDRIDRKRRDKKIITCTSCCIGPNQRETIFRWPRLSQVSRSRMRREENKKLTEGKSSACCLIRARRKHWPRSTKSKRPTRLEGRTPNQSGPQRAMRRAKRRSRSLTELPRQSANCGGIPCGT